MKAKDVMNGDVYSVDSVESLSRAEWTRIPLTGQVDGEIAVRSPFDLVSVDGAFQSAVEAGLAPGSTFVLVPDSLQTS